MIPIITSVSACVVKGVRVGGLSVGIAVTTGAVTSMISVVRNGFGVPTVSRHLLTPSVVQGLAAIPNVCAEVFGANKR